MKMVLAYLTTKDKKEALRLGEYLVKKKLAACVNVLPLMESVYVWEGKLEKSREAVLIVKTAAKKKNAVLKAVREKHGYSCPCVLFFDVKGGNPDYLKWLARSLR